MTLHLLHLTPYYAPAYSFGGVVRATDGLTRALVRRGHRVTVLTTDALSLDDRLSLSMTETQHQGVRVLRCPNLLYPLRRFNLSTPGGMRSQARALLPDVDVLHLHEFRTIENALVTPLAGAAGVPMVLSPHGTLTTTTGRSLLKRAWDALLSRSIARRIAQVVALTAQEQQDAQRLWQQLGAEAAFRVVPNGIDPAEFAQLPDGTAFRARYGLGEARVVLFLGRLHARKGVDVLVRAFQAANLPDAKLVIAGPDEGMRETLLGLADADTVLTGYLDSAERLDALSAADVFALPATGEGLSMAVLEAMAAGLPVLLSPGCNLPEVEPAGAGSIVTPDVASLAAALREMLSDDRALHTMSENARSLVHDRFTWERVAQHMEAVYQQVLASSSGG
jgi:glycosyltransferase involved in cell wall biosynthesis